MAPEYILKLAIIQSCEGGIEILVCIVEPCLTDTCDIMDNSECPDYISIDFTVIFKPSQQRTPRYSI